MEYRIEEISSNHLEHIAMLNAEVFGQKSSISELAKIFDTTCFGLYTIGFIAYSSDNEPAAYYGVFPIKMTVNNRCFLAAQSGATMTSPKHQKKGLFIKLASATYSRAAELGVELVYGFPNENSYPGFVKKLNWQFQGYISNHIWTNRTIPFCEISHRLKFLSSLYSSHVRARLKKFEIKHETLIPNSSDQFEILKNLEFFNYKKRNSRVFSIEINGFKMLVKPDVHLNIGFVEKFEEKRTRDFITTLHQLAKTLGCRKTVVKVSPNHWLNTALVAEHIPDRGLPIGVLPLKNNLELEQVEICYADFDTF